MSYYNTTNLKGDGLKSSQSKAISQSALIYSFFLDYNKPLSPSMVLKKLNLKCPITSVRRAITNLTLDNKIVKTSSMVEGNYGKPEHLWKVKTDADDIIRRV